MTLIIYGTWNSGIETGDNQFNDALQSTGNQNSVDVGRRREYQMNKVKEIEYTLLVNRLKDLPINQMLGINTITIII